MAAKTYSEKLRDPRWQKMRLEIMGRDKFCCRLCGDAESTLNVHHLFYTRGAEPWDYPAESLVTICDACHEELHITRVGESWLQALIEGGARLEDLYGLVYAFQFEFNDGPFAARLPRELWKNVDGAIGQALMAVRRGATPEQIYEALKDLRETDGKSEEH